MDDLFGTPKRETCCSAQVTEFWNPTGLDSPTEVSTDRAPACPRVLDELLPSARHVVERYANNPVETDHGRLKARLRPMRGLKQLGSVRVISVGHAFVQNARRGHYELATDVDPQHRLATALAELALAV